MTSPHLRTVTHGLQPTLGRVRGGVLFGPIAAVGAGLHMAALYIEHEAHISETAVVLTVAIPLAACTVALTGMAALMVGRGWSVILTVGVKLAVVALAVGLAAAGANVVWCVVVPAVAPAVSVVAHEIGFGSGSAREVVA